MDSVRTIPRSLACPSADEWSAFYLGCLPDDAVRTLAEHLEQCADCSARLPALEGQTDTLVQELRRPLEEDSYAKEPACREALSHLRDLVPQLLAQPASGENLSVPRQLGPYQLLRKLGAGSMGTVYQARHERLNRIVALKILSNRRASDACAVSRFRREIEVVGRLQHCNIIRSTDAGEADNILYFAMEFIAGIDLARLVQARGPLRVADACELVRQAALGLHHAHTHRLVHRDVKPSNLLLGGDGQVKVLDLGLALPPANAPGEDALTSSGQVLGTLDYMAPEQCRNTHTVDARTDVYSLGCTLYYLLAGHVPFAGSRYETPQSKLWAHAYETPPSLRAARPDVSLELAALLERLLAKEAAARFASAQEVADALAPFAAGSDLRALLAGLDLIPASPPEHEQPNPSPADLPPRRAKLSGLRRVLLFIAASFLLVGFVWSAIHKLTKPGDPAPRVEAPSTDGAPAADTPSTNGIVPKTAPESGAQQLVAHAPPRTPVYPTALFVFEERGAGAKEMGQKVTDLLFAKLVAKDSLTLVDREDLKKTLGEAELNLSGAVKLAEATKVGQLTGAKILVTGSVIHVEKKLYLVAKIIGTETSRVFGASVDGKLSDELEPLVEKLADRVAETIAAKSDDLVAKTVAKSDRLAALKDKLKKSQKPTVMVKVSEKHIGMATIDPAAQTELTLFLKECGFEVIDAEEGQQSKADVIIRGEGISAFASQHGNLMTVKARLEVKAVERRTDRVLAVDRQTTVVVDLTEALAGKAALQEAAADIAERLLPKLVKEPKEEKKP